MYSIIIFSFVIVTFTNVTYNFCHTKMKIIQFFIGIQKVEKKINFLIKIIYNIFCIIKKELKFRNYFLVLKKLFQTQFFLPYNQKHRETYQKKIIKFNKTLIQIKKEREE